MEKGRFTHNEIVFEEDYQICYISEQKYQEIDPHFHSDYEICLYLGDEIDYQIGNYTYNLKKGNFLLIPPNTVHYPIFKDKGKKVNYEGLTLWFTREWWDKLLALDPMLNFAFEECEKNQCYVLNASSATWQGLHSPLRMVYNNYHQRKISYDVACKANLFTFFVHLNRTYYYKDTKANCNHGEHILINDILTYIQGNMLENISLESVSKLFLISESTLSKLFRENMDTSFYKYVTQRRLVEAKNSILSGVPIIKASSNSGFNDYSTFYRAFKKEYGMSPSQFFKENR